MYIAGVRQIGVIMALPGRCTVALVGKDGLLDMYGEEIRARGIKDSDIRDWWATAKLALGVGRPTAAPGRNDAEDREKRRLRYLELKERRVNARLSR